MYLIFYKYAVISTFKLKKPSTYLHEWMVAQQTIYHILQAIDSYNPQMEMILLVKDG